MSHIDISTLFSHYIHYLVLDGIVYLCISDEGFSRQLAFTFLEEEKNRFVSTYPKASSAIAYAYQTDFSRVMKQLMVRFRSLRGLYQSARNPFPPIKKWFSFCSLFGLLFH